MGEHIARAKVRINDGHPVVIEFHLPTLRDFRVSFTAHMYKSIKSSCKKSITKPLKKLWRSKSGFKKGNGFSRFWKCAWRTIATPAVLGYGLVKSGANAVAKYAARKCGGTSKTLTLYWRTDFPCPRCNPKLKENKYEYPRGQNIMLHPDTCDRCRNADGRSTGWQKGPELWCGIPQWDDKFPIEAKVNKIKKNKSGTNITIMFEGSKAIDRVIRLKEQFYNLHQALKWINLCGHQQEHIVQDDVLQAVLDRSRRRNLLTLDFPIVTWLMETIEAMEALDWRTRPARS